MEGLYEFYKSNVSEDWPQSPYWIKDFLREKNLDLARVYSFDTNRSLLTKSYQLIKKDVPDICEFVKSVLNYLFVQADILEIFSEESLFELFTDVLINQNHPFSSEIIPHKIA